MVLWPMHRPTDAQHGNAPNLSGAKIVRTWSTCLFPRQVVVCCRGCRFCRDVASHHVRLSSSPDHLEITTKAQQTPRNICFALGFDPTLFARERVHPPHRPVPSPPRRPSLRYYVRTPPYQESCIVTVHSKQMRKQGINMPRTPVLFSSKGSNSIPISEGLDMGVSQRRWSLFLHLSLGHDVCRAHCVEN